MSPHYDPELEDSQPIFLHNNLAHDDASPYQVWFQKVRQLRRYHPDEHIHLNFEPFCDLDLDHNRAIRIFSHENTAYDDLLIS